MALSRILVRRMIHFNERIESFSADTIPRRLARALLRFSDRLGQPEDHGWVSMPAFTHGLLGEYIGTDREIVSVCLSQFRRHGYLRYSRTILTLNAESLREFLRLKTPLRFGEMRRRAAQPLRAVRSHYDEAQAPQPNC